MGNPKYEYMELFLDGKLKSVKSINRWNKDIAKIFESEKKFKKINDNLVEFEVNEKIRRIAIFWLVSSGKEKEIYKKRVEISKKMSNEIKGAEYIVAVYKNENNIIYLKLDIDPTKLIEINAQWTDLFSISIKELIPSLSKKFSIVNNVMCRGNLINIIISKNMSTLFSCSDINIEKNRNCNSDFIFFEEEGKKTENNNNNTAQLSLVNDDTILNQEIGFAGEKWINSKLKDRSSKIYTFLSNRINLKRIESNWLNEHGESKKPYDFHINKKIFLEIKSSQNKENSFFLTKNEFSLLKEQDNYWLIKLSNVDLNLKNKITFEIFSRDDIFKMKKEVVKYKFSWEN